MKYKIWLYVCLSVCIATVLASEEKPLVKASFLPHWAPQAQFAGYYVAYEKGIYKKYGLDVTIIVGGPDSPPDRFLEEGKVDFASLWLSAGIKERSRGIKIINIAQVMKKSALMMIAKRSSGIRTPKDMQNKKVSLWGDIFRIQPLAFFKKFDLTVTIVPQGYNVTLFLRDGVDVLSAMWYNEYHTILNSGYDPDELITFFYYDYGLNFPEDGIYVNEDYYNQNPERCCAFVRASMEGWQYAFEHPDEALNIVLKYMRIAHRPANRVHQKWMLERMKDLMTEGSSAKLSWKLSETDYTSVSQCLQESGFIDSIPAFNDFYRKCPEHDET